MTGPQRAMLYHLAIETGLRRKELASLTTSSFDWKACSVTVQAAYSKRRRLDVLPLRQKTAMKLQEHLSGKLPSTQAFDLPQKTSNMLKADLADAGIDYVNDAGQYADFHSLRHTTGSWLAANNVHPKVAQSIMRHSDINLTMSRYTHTLTGQEAEAIESLPDLSSSGQEQQRATGTDGKGLSEKNEPRELTPQLTPTTYPESNHSSATVTLAPNGLTDPDQHKSLTNRHIVPDDDVMSPGVMDNGEGGIRTRGTGVYPYDGLANRCLKPLGHLSNIP